MRTILDVVDALRQDDPPLSYLAVGEPDAPGKFLEFEILQWDDKVRILPSDALNMPGRHGGRSFVYRGQVRTYPACQASLLRAVPNDEWQMRSRLILERIRVAELALLLRGHPFSLVAAKHGLPIDHLGLAQHYGLPTSLLDLTSTVEVAAFFAVAQWDRDARNWTPMESGVGIVYRVDWSAFGPGYSRFFQPVGFGPGLRPARQHAFSFRLRPGADFAKIPHVMPFEFTHSARASAEIFAGFDNGSLLFPPDCLASLVERLRDLPFVTMHAIRHAAREDGLPAADVETQADRTAHILNKTLGVEIIDGWELQLEVADLAVARQQAPALDEAIRQLRWTFRLARTLIEPASVFEVDASGVRLIPLAN